VGRPSPLARLIIDTIKTSLSQPSAWLWVKFSLHLPLRRHLLKCRSKEPQPGFGLKPVVFVLNNDGYLIERLLCKDPTIAYNDIAPWHDPELPHAFGCDDWLTARVTDQAA
jgi:hypothetical protein